MVTEWITGTVEIDAMGLARLIAAADDETYSLGGLDVRKWGGVVEVRVLPPWSDLWETVGTCDAHDVVAIARLLTG